MTVCVFVFVCFQMVGGVKQFTCPHNTCASSFTHYKSLRRHLREKHERSSMKECAYCGQSFSRQENLRRHALTHSRKRTRESSPSSSSSSSSMSHDSVRCEENSFAAGPLPKKQKEQQGYGVFKEVEDIHTRHKRAISTHEREGPLQNFYNFKWPTIDSFPEWDAYLLDIFNRQKVRFKINLSHSFILYNAETNRYRFFHASQNNATYFDEPMLINNIRDFNQFLSEIRDIDHLEYARQQRPDTKWVVHSITSTSFYCTKLNDFPIGCCKTPIPNYIKRNKGIISLEHDNKRLFKFQDQKCFFRALALHQGATVRNLARPANRLYKRWLKRTKTRAPDFCGIKLPQLKRAEKLFKVNVEVFQFDMGGGQRHILTPVRRSQEKFSKTMRLVLFENHFCYVKNINLASRTFSCNMCGKLWNTNNKCLRHERNCTGTKVRHTYPGGVFHPELTVLELLARHGIQVDTSYVYKYRSTFDFETYYPPSENLPTPTNPDSKTEYIAEHIPLSVAMTSNIPNFKTVKCLITEGNTQKLIDKMGDYLEEMSDYAYMLLKEDFSDVFEQLDALDEQQKDPNQQQLHLSMSVRQLREKFESYLHQLPVVGFNSGKYDLQVIKRFLVRRFNLSRAHDASHENRFPSYVIQRGNQFMCITTKKLKFLDILNFVAPGFSYAQYLAGFGIKERKGFWPFEYITDIKQLNSEQLPPKSAFYSFLKDEAISNKDYNRCKRAWRRKKMKTMRDFLIWYSVRDVRPMLKAIEKQVEFYQSLGLDMLKDAISVPGLTLRYLYKTFPHNTFFSIINEKNKDLHDLMKDQTTGGPAIVFHRYHMRNETFIRGHKKHPVQSVKGYDCNSLYLHALSQFPMPTGNPIRRRFQTGYKAEVNDVFGQMSREWMEWQCHKNPGIKIHHKFNGREQQLGSRRIRVDGWDPDNMCVYNFHGCLFHGCKKCEKDKGLVVNPFNNVPMKELRKKTREISTYLSSLNITLYEMYECEWVEFKKQNPEVKQFLQTQGLSPTPSPFQYPISKEDILKAVRKETCFGFVQCDIEVPENLKDKFSELQPLFKNAYVSRDNLSDLMREYAEQNKLLSQPRRTLVGSFFGKNILLTTPLLRWYLNHGLEVTHIEQIVEYTPQVCFRQFGEMVSNARRESAANPNQAILGDSYKLLGNSAYGRVLCNKGAHKQIRYTNESQSTKFINDTLFRKLTPLDADLYEIESAKKKVIWDLPAQMGQFVYSYAKLRMLEFYYDFLDRFIPRSRFQLLLMDTDSMYIALPKGSLEDSVPPSRRRDFYSSYYKWFPALACDKHQKKFVSERVQGREWDVNKRKCCKKRHVFDERTPGLFKLEFAGKGVIALCSKTYYCVGKKKSDDKRLRTKFICKGLSKRLNKLTKDTYYRVLQNKQSGGGINRGFRTDGRGVLTYQQQRKSLSYFYCKRKVGNDGVSTYPIDV